MPSASASRHAPEYHAQSMPPCVSVSPIVVAVCAGKTLGLFGSA